MEGKCQGGAIGEEAAEMEESIETAEAVVLRELREITGRLHELEATVQRLGKAR